ncbi:carotenoid oxygenase family protein [Microbacterium marinum]
MGAAEQPVLGKLREDLAGALFRIANSPRTAPRDLDRYHWWEGDGGVAATHIRDGKASFWMKWVMTDSMKIEVEAGEAVYSGVVNGLVSPPAGAPPVKNVADTNGGLFADHLLVYNEGWLRTRSKPGRSTPSVHMTSTTASMCAALGGG